MTVLREAAAQGCTATDDTQDYITEQVRVYRLRRYARIWREFYGDVWPKMVTFAIRQTKQQGYASMKDTVRFARETYGAHVGDEIQPCLAVMMENEYEDVVRFRQHRDSMVRRWS